MGDVGVGATVKTKVVNIHVNSDYDVYVGRWGRGLLGNPIVIGGLNVEGERERRVLALTQFVDYFEKRIMADAVFRGIVSALKGKTLACHCAPAPCHAEVYAAWCDEGWEGVTKFKERLRTWAVKSEGA